MTWNATTDIQLWVMAGDDYTFPIFATPGLVAETGEKLWRVSFPIFFYHSVCIQLKTKIVSACTHDLMTAWFVPEPSFLAMATKAESIRPEHFVKLPSDTKAKLDSAVLISKTGPPPDHSIPSDDFIRDAQHRTGVLDLSTFRLVWITLLQEMPRWLTTQEKPIHLGWAKLHAFPYRANWKQIMLSWFPLIWKHLANPADWPKLEQYEFAKRIRSTLLLAMDSIGQRYAVTWTLECERLKSWDEFCYELEKHRLDSTTHRAYLEFVAGWIQRNWVRIRSSFRAFVQSTRSPCADLVFNRRGDPDRLVPHVPRPGIRPCAVEDGQINFVSDDCGPRLFGASEEPLSGTADQVPFVPTIRLHTK